MIRRHPRTALIAGASIMMLVLALGAVWVRNRVKSELPDYLERDNPVVQEAAAQALTRTDLLRELRERIADAMPGRDDLWVTQTSFQSDAATTSWERGREITLSTFAPWHVPEAPTWAEDPYRNITWQFYYQSLGWLWAPGRACLDGTDAACREVADYVLGWIRSSPPFDPPSVRSWYDHAVAYRTDAIVSLYADVLAPNLSPAEFGTLMRSLELHGRTLDGFLHDPAFTGHNHNLFHALSLYNLAVAFPELRGSATWKSDARARIASLLPEMVQTDEGVSLEEAFAYHYLALRLFAGANRYLERHGDGLSSSELSVLDGMTEFGALILSPAGEMPAVGDTPYGSTSGESLLKTAAGLGITSAIARYVLSKGANGSKPRSANFYPAAGYAVIRPEYTAGPGWSKDLQLIVDTSTRRRVHGHADAMNVILSAEGGPLLVDSGGPYLYGNAAHAAFVAPSAHNVVVDLDAADAQAVVTGLTETDDRFASVVGGTVGLGDAAQDHRTIILVKPALLVIADRITALDGQAHRYGLLYHLPPGADVRATGPGGNVTAGPAGMGYRILSSCPMTSDVVSGQAHPLLGWVTRSYGGKDPAPVLRFEQTCTDGWFVTVMAPAAAGSAHVPDVKVRPDASGRMTIDVASPILTHIRIGMAGEVESLGR